MKEFLIEITSLRVFAKDKEAAEELIWEALRLDGNDATDTSVIAEEKK